MSVHPLRERRRSTSSAAKLPVSNEQALVAAFVKRNERDRYREILSNPRLRHKFTQQLAHFADFDPKYRLPIPSNKLFVDNIAFEL